MQMLKFTESIGNEQYGHTEPLKNVKDYSKTVKLMHILKKSDLIFQTFVGRPRNAEIGEIS